MEGRNAMTSWASKQQDQYFTCPKCLDKDNIDFIPDVHVRCESCHWMFDFQKCKTINRGKK